MKLMHPIAPYRGIPPEDCFVAANDQMLQMGTGYVTPFFQQELYPEAPLMIYMHLEAQPVVRSVLLGALIARAEQIRANNPQAKGRLYTQIAPDDWDLANFYTRSGFKADLHRHQLVIPGQNPPGRSSAQIPQGCFIMMTDHTFHNTHTPFYAGLLTQCMQMEHFLAVGFYRGAHPVSEMLLTGEGQSVTLVSLYVRSDYRRQGFAKAILGAAADILRPRGVTQISARVFSRNAAQIGLMHAAGGKKVRTLSILPGISL